MPPLSAVGIACLQVGEDVKSLERQALEQPREDILQASSEFRDVKIPSDLGLGTAATGIGELGAIMNSLKSADRWISAILKE